MAAVPITIIGTLTDKDGSQNVTIAGMASITGLEVGGGPIMPGKPPGGDYHPAHPIELPPSIWPGPGDPDFPIGLPPSIWPDPPEGVNIPAHPIVLPHPPQIQGPDLQVKIVWTADDGWAVILVPTGTTPAPSATPAGRRG